MAIPRIHRYTKPGPGSVNSYIVEGRESLTLIDTQRTLVEARELLALVRSIGKPLESIVLTHEHPDHVGGAALFLAEFPGIPLWASPDTLQYIETEGPRLVRLMKQFFGKEFVDDIPRPTRLFQNNDAVRFAGVEFRVDQLPACEATAMSLFYSEEHDTLFCADVVGHHMTPWVGDQHVASWLEQLAVVSARYGKVDRVLPGHGSEASAIEMFGPQRDLLLFYRELVQREAKGRAELDEGARRRIQAATEERYPPRDYPGVAGFPFLADWNMEAMAAELASMPWDLYTAKIPDVPITIRYHADHQAAPAAI